MDEGRARRLLARHGPKGYDPEKGLFWPWWRLAQYSVEVRMGKGIPHVFGRRIVVVFAEGACPHVVVHDLFHEVGHVQTLPIDILVLGATVGVASEGPWWALVLALLGWKFLWREFTADLWAASRIGWRNVVRGYTHLGRKVGGPKGQARGMSKGREVSQ